MEQHLPEFPEEKTTSKGIPKVLKISYQEFLFYIIFLTEFPKFSFERFAEIRKLFKEVLVPFACVSKSSGNFD